jgi:hypothetical protein
MLDAVRTTACLTEGGSSFRSQDSSTNAKRLATLRPLCSACRAGDDHALSTRRVSAGLLERFQERLVTLGEPYERAGRCVEPLDLLRPANPLVRHPEKVLDHAVERLGVTKRGRAIGSDLVDVAPMLVEQTILVSAKGRQLPRAGGRLRVFIGGLYGRGRFLALSR